ncbi:hypothetical protein FL857_10865 [Criibacterium bergeronii]|uniref:Uncharacterized protein n=1 Tax=Criibacterium bergeronii TaxID=1871336 RepID=A0A552UXE0_9FIRM|nr:DUF6017 domain-containing protein [Criibacterium bergeronii]TRW22903.1 hypothetical protein FL857_10865 [Criibacterium bergeronii]
MFKNNISNLYDNMISLFKCSVKNNFTDSKEKVCIIYTRERIMKEFGVSKPTAIKMVKELKNLGLIEEKRQWFGKPNLIYLTYNKELEQILNNEELKHTIGYVEQKKCNYKQMKKENSKKVNYEVSVDDEIEEIKNQIEELSSRLLDLEKRKQKTAHNRQNKGDLIEDRYKTSKKNKRPLKNDYNAPTSQNTKKNDEEKAKIKDEADEVIKKFKDNIEYDLIKNDKIYNQSNSNLLENFVEIIKIALSSKSVRVNRQEISSKVFAERILKLNQFHIEYVVECITKLKTKIRNIPAYVLTSIYNSYTTIDMYYDNLLCTAN